MTALDEAAFLCEVCARLPNADCCGCHDCAGRCAGNLRITRTEFEAIRRHLDGGGWFPAVRGDADMVVPCEFQEPDGPRCLVYPVRPLVCRLFGLVEWLPCPRGRLLPPVPDGLEIIRTYAAFERHTFREWLRAERAGPGGVLDASARARQRTETAPWPQ